MQVYDIGKIGERTIHCDSCYARIGYFPAEINCTYAGKTYIEYLKCPVCGKAIILKKEEVT